MFEVSIASDGPQMTPPPCASPNATLLLVREFDSRTFETGWASIAPASTARPVDGARGAAPCLSVPMFVERLKDNEAKNLAAHTLSAGILRFVQN
jgi:hypothetical protein